MDQKEAEDIGLQGGRGMQYVKRPCTQWLIVVAAMGVFYVTFMIVGGGLACCAVRGATAQATALDARCKKQEDRLRASRDQNTARIR